jgi:para-aminobenzoate synthetase component 1
MTPPAATRPLFATAPPTELLRAWPAHRPLLLLHSGGGGAARTSWNRWTIAAEPSAWRFVTADGADPAATIGAIVGATRRPRRGGGGDDDPPFSSGWIGLLAYELGAAIEPVARKSGRAALARSAWPLAALARCDGALVYDHLEGRWHAAGPNPPEMPAPPARERRRADAFAIGAWNGGASPADYRAAVTRIIELIAAGDAFQVNYTQRLRASFAGSTRALAHCAFEASGAWYGASLELPGGRAVVSMSPELFLAVDAHGRAVTRPIKGTRPASGDPRDLLASEKDAAELHMIVDLMRNDLGRVARFGSVAVPAARTIETHARLHHGVGEVRATLAEGTSVADLLRATFPPGSVTGAPKIRAMQIIEELERRPRGPYCGAIGFFDDAGGLELNVAIRTLALRGRRTAGDWGALRGTIIYGAGGGIVADSDPAAEHRESLDKAAILAALRGELTRPPSARPAAPFAARR